MPNRRWVVICQDDVVSSALGAGLFGAEDVPLHPGGPGPVESLRAVLEREGWHVTVVSGPALRREWSDVLTVISGFAQIALDRLPADAPARLYLTHIQETARRSFDSIRRLLQPDKQIPQVARKTSPATGER